MANNENNTNNEGNSNQEIQLLQQQLEICQQMQKESHDRFLRLNADFENYKKRVAKDQAQWIEGAQVQLIKKLLPVIDDIERAFEQPLPTEQSQIQTWLAGFSMIKSAVYTFLKEVGVEEIPAMKTFNPEYHEAIAQVTSDQHVAGDIVAVLQRGYKLKDIVIRPARVSVAQ